MGSIKCHCLSCKLLRWSNLFYKSPGPPFFYVPCPLRGITFPVSTPAGILTEIFCFSYTSFTMHSTRIIYDPYHHIGYKLKAYKISKRCLPLYSYLTDPLHVGHVWRSTCLCPVPLRITRFTSIYRYFFSTPKQLPQS